MLTAYCFPLANAVGNVNVPLPVTVIVSPPLFCKITEPLNPVTVPPTVMPVVEGVGDEEDPELLEPPPQLVINAQAINTKANFFIFLISNRSKIKSLLHAGNTLS